MDDLRFQFDRHPTTIKVKSNILEEVGTLLRTLTPDRGSISAVVITDECVAELYASTLLESLAAAGFPTLEYRIKPGEGSKSLTMAEQIYDFLSRHHAARDAVVVALGGGVVSDLAGFVAATWMRGVRFVICPTTLEADVDAAVGGKTAINVPGGKNLVGVFHQPILVAVDPVCLRTLEPRDISAGLAESIKHAMISSEEFLSWHEADIGAILSLDEALITELIERNIRIKANIVAQDPLEQSGSRAQLNFGHTIGHAIESCCGFALRHGECVALGMLAASRMSGALGLLDFPTVTRLEAVLRGFNLPTTLADPIDADQIMEAIRNDKKVRGGRQHFVLLEGVGRTVIRHDVPEKEVRKAYETLLP